jgi:hypothetical protein
MHSYRVAIWIAIAQIGDNPRCDGSTIAGDKSLD